MASHYPPVVEELIRQKMASGRYDSEEQLLVEALNLLGDDEDEEDDLKAIQEGLESLDRGERGTPLDEAFRELRQKYGLQG